MQRACHFYHLQLESKWNQRLINTTSLCYHHISEQDYAWDYALCDVRRKGLKVHNLDNLKMHMHECKLSLVSYKLCMLRESVVKSSIIIMYTCKQVIQSHRYEGEKT